jgi:hypothetical protein
VQAHFDEVNRLRTVGTALAAQAAEASVRSRRAEQEAAALRAELADLRSDTAVLREELARLREEVLWAWAEGRLPIAHAAPSPAQADARVIDLREHTG